MRRFLLLFFTALLCGAAFGQGPALTVVNDTGYDIRYLYISSNNTDNWEDDVLGRRVLQDGNTFKLTLPENGTYDFKAVDEDGDAYIKWNVMVRGDQTITFTASDFQQKAERGEPAPCVVRSTPSSGTWVTVVNNTGYDIHYLYMSRGDDDDWFDDILGSDEILEAREQIRIVLPGPGSWDMRAIDADDDDYYKYDQSISSGANRITFLSSDLD